MKQHKLVFGSILCAVLIGFHACKSDDSKKSSEASPILLKPDEPTDSTTQDVAKTPIIQLSDTSFPALNLVLVRDSASNSARLSMKLAQIYTQKLLPSIQRNKLTIVGAPMAFYKSQEAPFFFEAGFAVDRMPKNKVKGVISKRTVSSRAIIANFYGPYESTVQAYDVLKAWLKENKKKSAGAPFEIYVDDPIGTDGKPKDPYQVLTQIVMPYH